MAAPAAILDILIRTNTSAAQAGLAKTQGSLVATERAAGRTTASTTRTSRAMSKLGTAAKIGGAALAAGLVIELKRSVDEAREAAKAHAQTEAVIKSMGNQANVSVKHVEKLAEKISEVAGVDDELIQSQETVLLTFSEIRNEVGKGNKIFDRATQTVADLSARFNVDLGSATKMVGKALNDPIAGLTSLSRVGVQFTEQQKDQITTLVESGKTLKAQKVIMANLEKQTKGAAAAEADPFNKLGVSVENLEEKIGTLLLPELQKVATWATDFINQIQKEGFGDALNDQLGKGVKKLAVLGPKAAKWFVESFVKAGIWGKVGMGLILTRLIGGKGIFQSLGKKAALYFLGAMKDWFLASKIGQTVANTVSGQPEAWRTAGTTRGKMFGAGLLIGLVLAIPLIMKTLQDGFNDKMGKFNPLGSEGIFGNSLKKDFDRSFGKLGPAFKDAFRGLKEWFKNVDFGAPFRKMKQVAQDAWNWVKDKYNSLPGVIKDAMSGVGGFLIAPFQNAVSKISGFVQDIIDVINTVLGPIGVHIGGGGGGTQPGPSGPSGPTTGKKYQKQAKKNRKGGLAGVVPGSGAGDKVLMQAMVEPNEGIFVMNRNAMAGLAAINQSMPRKIGGGTLSAVGGAISGAAGKVASKAAGLAAGLPGVGSLPPWLKAGGQFVVDKAAAFIANKAKSLVGAGGGGVGGYTGPPASMGQLGSNTWVDAHTLGVAAFLAKKFGLSVSSGYRTPAHNAEVGGVANSLHTHGSSGNPGAIDFVPPSSAALGFASSHIAGLQEAMIHDTGSGLHLHLGFFKKGGQISPHSPGAPAVGNTWLKGTGGNWTPDEIFTALRQLGAPKEMAGFLSAVSVGESGGNPRAVGHDPGGTRGLGLLQITTKYNDDIIRQFGGEAGMMNPWENLLAGMAVYKRQGPSAWYGHAGSTGRLLKERIMRAAKNAPRGRGASGNGTGNKPAPGFGGVSADTLNTGANAMNELIAQGNLEGMQRYQLGMAQNPLLGIPSPAYPFGGAPSSRHSRG